MTNQPASSLEYLTASELCKQSNLSQENLNRLEKYRLLIPSRKNRYRPTQVLWAKKLAYLLDHNWELQEIKNWASGRFQSANPKQWPPKRSDWKG